MTERTGVLTVLLTDDMRVDDVESLINAIRMLHGVAGVEIEQTDVIEVSLAKQRLRLELWDTMREALLK